MKVPASIQLPEGSVEVVDADEEIFLLYTRKNQSRSPESSIRQLNHGKGKGRQVRQSKLEEDVGSDSGGLGFLSTSANTVNLTVTVSKLQSLSHLTAEPAAGKRAGRRPSKGKGTVDFTSTGKEISVEVEIYQSLQTLMHRRGDTGSVVWRLSIYLAHLLLHQAFFEESLQDGTPPLLKHWSRLKVLELGSGTGFLGIVLARTVQEWIFTDLLDNLKLVQRNIKVNNLSSHDPSSNRSNERSCQDSKGQRSGHENVHAAACGSSIVIEELDWINEGLEFERFHRLDHQRLGSSAGTDDMTSYPNLLLCVDCIYNPSISVPLAKTITRRSGPDTVALVASELRDAEPLEVFLKAWLELGWKVTRVNCDGGERYLKRAGEGLREESLVIWVGWREESRDVEEVNLL